MATQTLGLVVRVSRMGKREEDGERFYSKADQVRDGTRVAELAEYAVRVYDADLDVSGATPFDDRPGMGAALRDLEAGRIAGIVAAARDRLVRQDPAAGVTLAALQARIRAAGGVLIVGDTPSACVGRPGDVEAEGFAGLGLDVLVALDGRYREESRKRWRSGNRNAIERGVQPGRTPSWLDRDKDGYFHPNEHTPAVVEAVRARAAGASWREVADLLNARGVPTRRPDRRKRPTREQGWTYKTAEALCRCELLVGRVHWGQYRNDEAFAPLVDEPTWLLASHRRERPKGYRDRAPGLATSVAVCASCGHPMIQDSTRRRDGGKTPQYRCRSGQCDAPATITHNLLEPYLWDAAWTESDRRAQAELLSDAEPSEDGGPSPDELEAGLRTAEAEVAAFLTRVRATTPGFSEALDALMEGVEAAKARLAGSAAPRERTFHEIVEEGYRNLDDPAWRRALVLSVVKQARITKGSAPVAEKVEIVWR